MAATRLVAAHPDPFRNDQHLIIGASLRDIDVPSCS